MGKGGRKGRGVVEEWGDTECLVEGGCYGEVGGGWGTEDFRGGVNGEYLNTYVEIRLIRLLR